MSQELWKGLSQEVGSACPWRVSELVESLQACLGPEAPEVVSRKHIQQENKGILHGTFCVHILGRNCKVCKHCYLRCIGSVVMHQRENKQVFYVVMGEFFTT